MDPLLPPNRTALDAALSEALGPRLQDRTLGIRGLKADPADPLLPWLVWEYGLDELLPWLADPRRAIAEGVLWQRLRGTPQALTTALGWIDLAADLEEDGPGSRFALFQLRLGQAPNLPEVRAVVRLAQLSAPARARLARLHNPIYDVRRFVPSRSDWGDLLSDWSGVLAWGGGPKLSFGRGHAGDAALIASSASPQLRIHGVRASAWSVANLDRFLLDVHRLGDDPWHVLNPEVSGARLLAAWTGDHALPDPTSLLPRRVFAKAAIVLSEGPPLGDTNAVLHDRRMTELGGAFALDSDRLGDMVWHLDFAPIDERFDRTLGRSGSYGHAGPIGRSGDRWSGHGAADIAWWPILDEPDDRPLQPGAAHFNVRAYQAAWPGAAWPRTGWPSRPWSALASPSALSEHQVLPASADRSAGFAADLDPPLLLWYRGRFVPALVDAGVPSIASAENRDVHIVMTDALDDRRWARRRWPAAPWTVPSHPAASGGHTVN
jgi:P2-related tail formation protein